MATHEDQYKFKLAKYLLNYDPHAIGVPDIDEQEYNIEAHLYTDEQILNEINQILHLIKPYARPAFTALHSFMHSHVDKIQEVREDKHEMLEHAHYHDTDLLRTLQEFIIITIALLVKLERMHKKHILCGNINPYTFMYSKKTRQCEPVDLGVILSDKNVVKAEPQAFGDYLYLVTDLAAMPYNRYLAPELKESVRVYRLQKRLIELSEEATKRNIGQNTKELVSNILQEFHQKKIKYTNRAEIYSVGYTINQVLSHLLSKFAHLGLRINEFPHTAVDPKIIEEAELLLPSSLANPHKERILALVNEAIEYTYDLMHEHMEKRDTLELSIEKFMSLLKRSSITKPDEILEAEEEEGEELEYEGEGEHEHKHVHKHAEHEHEHEHEEHEHEEHEHEAHEHAEHEHEHKEHEHEHEEHEHAEHEHAEHEHEHEHEVHEHAEHEHEHEHEAHEHAEHEHEHAEHEHEEHEHEEHEHEEHEHEHEEHEHEEHEHEEHEHEEHEHEEHEHAEHEHEEQEHAEHEEHDEHEHEEHEHEEHEHDEEEHEEGHHEEEHAHEDHGEDEHGGHGEADHEEGRGEDHPEDDHTPLGRGMRRH